MIIKFNPKFKGPIRRREKVLTIRESNIKLDKLRPGGKLYLVADPITCQDDVILETICQKVEKITIKYTFYNMKYTNVQNKAQETETNRTCQIYVDDKLLNDYHLHHLAKNDGFKNITEFLDYHNKSMAGYIIHW
jgi:hypothetical protein